MTHDITMLYDAIDATWAPASMTRVGPWTIREGRDGGSRVSAATAAGPVTEADLPQAEAAMRGLGQTPLFMIRQGDAALDAMLAEQGYDLVDPVNLRLGPLRPLMEEPIPLARVFAGWEPLAIQREIWAAGGIGPERLAVMERVEVPKKSMLGRDGNAPAATAFVALHKGVAMMHAVEVAVNCRRRGMAALMCRQAAFWAAERGGTHLAALCTQANEGSNALCSSLGLEVVGQYHYRKATEENAR
ncbi:GNAT family N-acetyltransferase [Roseovarius amoyensis]|uniref:GNAT family N-acetyltransferase n=1 Tax=Roseovarius amoyensis TaxID=2211448 RepID=UPI000DBE1874|nr:GNAT family N-acetyltransferase [Roseovarius amoyensis]